MAIDGRVRIVRIITRLNVGGPALHAMLLTERLDPARYESQLVTGRVGRDEAELTDLRTFPGIRPIVISELRREVAPLHDLVALVKLIMILRRHRPDIVHTHMAKAGLLGRVAARLTGARVVVHTFHGNVLRGYFGRWQSRALVLIERVLAGLSTRIIAISPQQRAELIQMRIAPPDRIVEIPLGLDLGPFRDLPAGHLRRELGISASTPIVTIVARLVPIKAVDVFLEVAATLLRAGRNVSFVIVGDGPERGALMAHADGLGMTARVSFLGWRSDLPRIYGDTDVVVLTSRNEGTPVSVIEALAAKRPVVATAVGAVPDLLTAGRGLLATRDDVPALAEHVGNLLDDPKLREELGTRGCAYALSRFDAKRLTNDLDRLYTRSLDRAARRR